MGVDKTLQRQVFIQLVNFSTQLGAVLIPVENGTTDTGVILDKLEQVGIVPWIDDLKAKVSQRQIQFADWLIFIVGPFRAHDGENVHLTNPFNKKGRASTAFRSLWKPG